MSAVWKKGRGKLGIFAPLLGLWRAEGDGPMGPTTITRAFDEVLGGKYIELRVAWTFNTGANGKPQAPYQEICLFGSHETTGLGFWSFTSDGKRSAGTLGDGSDVHDQALCFEADMPGGHARMLYWPAEEGFFNAVESKTKKGWNRFFLHHFKPTGKPV